MPFAGGAISAGLAAAFESKPDVPDFHWTDLVQQQLDTTQGNLDVLGKSEQLGTGVNDFMRSERAKTLATIPGMADIEGQTVANLKDWLSGNLSQGTTSAVQRGANAKAYAGGYGGSGMGRNLTSRDLGLTSLQLQQSAVPLASGYMGQEYAMRKTPEWDPSSMFINPMQAAQFNAQQSQQQWNRNWLANRIDAQPEPWQQSLMDSWNSGMSMADSIGSSYLGGMAGGGAKPGASTPPPPPSGDGGGGGFTTDPNSYEWGGMPSYNQQTRMMNEYYGLK